MTVKDFLKRNSYNMFVDKKLYASSINLYAYIDSLTDEQVKSKEVTYETWDKETSLNGISADEIKQNILNNEDTDLYVIKQENTVLAITKTDPEKVKEDFEVRFMISNIRDMCRIHFYDKILDYNKQYEIPVTTTV